MATSPARPQSTSSPAPDWRTLVSAILIVFSFPPWNFYPLIWIALVPWFAALARARSTRAAFGQGMWLGIFMSIGGFYWVAHVLKEFGGLPGWVAAIGLGLFSLIGQPQFAIFGMLWRRLRLAPGAATVMESAVAGGGARRGTLALAAGLSLVYVAIDWTLPKLFVDTFGHSMYLARHLRQAADLGGATLLTFLIVFVNESLYQLFAAVRSRREPSLLPAFRSAGAPVLASLLLALTAWGYGLVRYRQVVEFENAPKRRLQAAIIQANIGDFDKVASEKGVTGAADKVIDTFFRMSDEALAHTPKPQVVIWPETSYPSTFRTPSTADESARDGKVESFARTRKTPLLFGGYNHYQDKDFNAFFFLTPTPQSLPSGLLSDLQIYRKNVLLMFGEYIPGAEYITFIRQTFPQVANFGRGEGPSVLGVPFEEGKEAARVAPIICYEALFPNYVIAGARKGAEMILNITNDSWFGESGEPILHLSLTTFRSIETRLPQLRATNTGISTLILPDGEITQASRIGVAENIHVSVPLVGEMWTLMRAWGDWFSWFAGIAGVALLAWARRVRATSVDPG